VENIEVLRQNGFEVETAAEGDSGPRLSLTAQPISKDTVFDMKGVPFILSTALADTRS
jgi:DNA mismatch repair protein PMS2